MKVKAKDGTTYDVTKAGDHGQTMLVRNPPKVRGKAAVKAAKRARIYRDGRRVS